MAPRASEDVFELFDLLPGVVQARTKADNCAGFLSLVIGRLDAGEIASDGQLDLLVTKPQLDAVRNFLLLIRRKLLRRFRLSVHRLPGYLIL